MIMRVAVLIACTALFGCSALPKPSSVAAVKNRQLWDTERFTQFHPDVHHRKKALWEMEQGRVQAAVEELKQSARYADKPSQAMLAELYWNGDHVARNRAEAYAWMDLAAERGYSLFLAKREAYWADMSPDERQRAMSLGQSLYAEYGDSVAKPRMDDLLRKARFAITGSRVGYVGALTVYIPDNGKWKSFDGSQFYAPQYWRADEYFEWTDSLWTPWPVGTVDVGGPMPTDARTDG